MIFHICPPDIKFIRLLVERFERVKPNFNRCIIIVSRHHNNPRTDINKNLIEYFGELNENIIKKINSSDCDGILVHTLNDDILELVLNISKKIPIIWRSWGPDLHDLLYPEYNLLLPYTQKLEHGNNLIVQKSGSILRSLKNQITGRTKINGERITRKLEFLHKVDYIATVTLKEYSMLQDRILGLKARHIRLNYRSLDLKELPVLVSPGSSTTAILGHSSYPYHNHADVLYYLKDDTYKGTIKVPLNYGENRYRNKIISLGTNLFNSRIKFLTEFLTFENYLKYISDSSAFILNSKVQSGGGNIIYFLCQGSMVYLREENPIYEDFIYQGIKVFSIQNDLCNDHLISDIFTIADKTQNKEIIKSLFNSKREMDNVINVYSIFGK